MSTGEGGISSRVATRRRRSSEVDRKTPKKIKINDNSSKSTFDKCENSVGRDTITKNVAPIHGISSDPWIDNSFVRNFCARLGKLDEKHTAGPGTYSRNGFIYSSLAGFLQSEENENGNVCFTVRREAEGNIVPSVGSLVTVKIKSVNPRFSKCDIFGVEKTLLKEPFRGMIRKEDVRATEKDRVELSKCFRPSDVVLARVISLGDAHSYVLTTAENELGVVIASSEAGVTMVPISWQEMQCPQTFGKEYRKVAKVQPHNIQYVT